MVVPIQTRTEMISIHALRGEGDHGYCVLCHAIRISIHALRGEGDRLRLSAARW